MKVYVVTDNPKYEGDGFSEVVLVTTNHDKAQKKSSELDSADRFGDVEEHEVVE